MKFNAIVIGDNKELCRKVQEILFGAGFHWGWGGHGQNVSVLDAQVLFASQDGVITWAERGYKLPQEHSYTLYSGNEITPELVATFAGAKKTVELPMHEIIALAEKSLGSKIKVKTSIRKVGRLASKKEVVNFTRKGGEESYFINLDMDAKTVDFVQLNGKSLGDFGWTFSGVMKMIGDGCWGFFD